MRPPKNRKRRWAVLAAFCALLAIAAAGLENRLTLRRYTVGSEKVKKTVRIALLTDLHSCFYGEGQRELLDMVEAQHPDVVLLGGDIVDDVLPEDNAWLTVRRLAARYPTYYVTGNHEYRSGRVETIRREMAESGVIVLAGECRSVLLQGQRVELCGVDDPKCGGSMWSDQLSAAAKAADPDCFAVLLSHRPERVEDYLAYDFDLVLSGHAHGGQWRLPGLVNGLLAPDQGFFPAYAGGLYRLDENTDLVVSRGLARESTRVPRIFNPPELVIIDVMPAE